MQGWLDLISIEDIIFLGSAIWLPTSKSIHSLNGNSQDLQMFLFCLRALVRSAHAVAFVTIPSYLYKEVSLMICLPRGSIKFVFFAGINRKVYTLRGYCNETPIFYWYRIRV